MKSEEIEKAAEEYDESLKSIAFENLTGDDIPYLLRGAFKEGLKSANKHWQEKTRWILVSERLPEVRETPYWIVVKNDEFDERVSIKIKDSNFIAYIKLYYKEWREIE